MPNVFVPRVGAPQDQVTLLDANGNPIKGELQFVNPGAGAPGGPNNAVQFNNAGAFGGSADFTWDDTLKILATLGTTAVSLNGTGPAASFSAFGFGSLQMPGTGPGSSFVGSGRETVNWAGVGTPASSFIASGFFAHDFDSNGVLGSSFSAQDHDTVDLSNNAALGAFFRANGYSNFSATGTGGLGDVDMSNYRSHFLNSAGAVGAIFQANDHQAHQLQGDGTVGGFCDLSNHEDLNLQGAGGGTVTMDQYDNFALTAAGATTQAREAAIVQNLDDDVRLMLLDNSLGTNGIDSEVYAGDRDPNGIITATVGSIYIRGDGLNSTIYINNNGGTGWTDISGGGGATQVISRVFSNAGNASNTLGPMAIVQDGNQPNPIGTFLSTSNGNPGTDNGSISPNYMPECTLVKAGLSVAHAAVSQGTTGGAMTARITVYKANFSSRTNLVDLDFPITSAGVFLNLGGNNFDEGIVLTAADFGVVNITEGDQIGAEFTNRSANNNEINGLGGYNLYLQFEL